MKTLLITLLITFFATNIYSYDKNLGSKNCSQCHIKKYDAWKATPHFKADEVLSKKEEESSTCASCHKPSKKDKGVTCESCHGGGKHYAKSYVMKDKKLSKILGLKKVTQKTCDRCHNTYSKTGKKDIKKYKELVCPDVKKENDKK